VVRYRRPKFDDFLRLGISKLPCSVLLIRWSLVRALGKHIDTLTRVPAFPLVRSPCARQLPTQGRFDLADDTPKLVPLMHLQCPTFRIEYPAQSNASFAKELSAESRPLSRRKADGLCKLQRAPIRQQIPEGQQVVVEIRVAGELFH
jgi:hypothetical protein